MIRNRYSKDQLEARLAAEPFARRTVSFYKYLRITDPQAFRDALFVHWTTIGVLGRIYVSREGINAQISVPLPNWNAFKDHLYTLPGLAETPLKVGLSEEIESFVKLTIKVKDRIVADGLTDDEINLQDIGEHIHAEKMNEAIEKGSMIIDMRNHYEYEIGHFQGAICPNTETFREALPEALDMAKGHEKEEVVLYCTGGIRCEKASAYFKKNGFENVKQMCGGIIDYKHEVAQQGLDNKYKGKNFVFDGRRAEPVGDEVVSQCHQCGSPWDHHTNCANDACHLLFLQCDNCKTKHQYCCSPACLAFVQAPESIQKVKRRTGIAIKKALNVYSRHDKRDLMNQDWSQVPSA